jgi:signal peptidase
MANVLESTVTEGGHDAISMVRPARAGRTTSTGGGRSSQRPARAARWAGFALFGLALTVALALTVGPRVFGYKALAVQSGSMEPGIPIGSLVVDVPADADRLRVGDVITFHRPDGANELITHRIVRIEERWGDRVFVTKGDANGAPDGWYVPASGSGLRYWFRIPFVGYLLAGAFARWAMLSLAAIVLCVVALVEIWRPKSAATL